MDREKIIEILKSYMATHALSKAALARKLEWSPQVLSNIMTGGESIGIQRQFHIAEKLGIAFKIGDGSDKVIESEIYKTTEEQEYTGKLLDILRGKNLVNSKAIKTNLDAFWATRNIDVAKEEDEPPERQTTPLGQ